ncbi:hypothetical protein K490DRAFT_63943 [Saccharata proteae CBS 121410]|uniref:Uncharacterized protein n=1 Tax=Saccharata proteae CBS 121410 TaxID=1314787 RepID=A0A6A5YAS3_9PEZI|nr:hypothetical protein K490DRAFT_63943 [Saccharata proteae CBS 121410]
MMDLGYSISELINLGINLKRIYDSFFAVYDNAPNRIRQLMRLVERFTSQLCELDWILKRTGREYPGQDDFKETLEECQSFIEEYRATLDRRSPRGVVQTALYTFDKEKVEWLLNRISIHVQGIGFFTNNLLLRKLYGVDDTIVTAAAPAVAPPNDLADELKELYKEATLYQYRRRRLDGQALQVSHAHHTGTAAVENDFHNFLDQVRRRLEQRGVVDKELETVHHLPVETALPNDLLLDYTEQGLARHAVSGASSRSRPLFTPTTVKIGSDRYEVCDILIKENGRKITSRNRSHTVTIIHRLSSDQSRYPYSTPAVQKPEVYFLGDQSVQVYKEGRQIMEATIETCHFEPRKTPIYKMTEAKAHVLFQEVIRDKDLQHVITFETLITGRRNNVNEDPESSYEYIKLWNEPNSHEVTASFFIPDAGTPASGRHMEFSSDWLKPLSVTKEKHVSLDFVSSHDLEPPPPPTRRTSSWSTFIRQRLNQSATKPAVPASPRHQPSPSSGSTATSTDRSPSSAGTTAVTTTLSSRDFFARDVKWLKIEFETVNDQIIFTKALKTSQDELREVRASQRHPEPDFGKFSFKVEEYIKDIHE